MAKKRLSLELKHVEQSMSADVLIGSDDAFDGQRKRFAFNPWANEYRVYHGESVKSSGQAVEELLIEYNEL